MEQITVNHITLTGALASAPEYSHSNHGRRFYSFYLEVSRLSGAIDRLQILASEELLASTCVTEGEALTVEGQIRSFNNRAPRGRKLIISVLAESIAITNGPHANQVILQGVICKEPVFRRTPLGREICDVMLAVNRPYHRADYLPCILWGRCAQEVSVYPVGTVLSITGRLQSREYLKVIDGAAEQRTAYEISAVTAEILSE
ncbi:MAG: single-stranded DNA-binding protein [Faecousia sp.]